MSLVVTKIFEKTVAAKGRRLTLNFTALDDCSGDPVDLTSATIKVWLSTKFNTVIEKSTDNGVVTTDPENGKFTATFGEGEMDQFPAGEVGNIEASAELSNLSLVQLGKAVIIVEEGQPWD